MSENKVLKFGIIGPGRIAEKFARAVALCENVEVYAVASSKLERAESFAEKFSVEKTYEGYESMLQDEGVDAVYIAVPHNFHVSAVELCAKYKKAILCEKPFSHLLSETEKGIAAAKENDVLLMEAVWTRFLPATLKVKEWIQAGKIGQVGLVQADFSCVSNAGSTDRLMDKNLAGGAILDIGIYTLAFALDMCDSKAKEVKAFTQLGKTGVDVLSTYMIEMENGAIFTGNTGFKAGNEHYGVIAGNEGYIKIPEFWQCEKCGLYTTGGKLVEEFESCTENGFIYEVEHFRDLYFAGKKESDRVSYSDTLEMSRIMDLLLAEAK